MPPLFHLITFTLLFSLSSHAIEQKQVNAKKQDSYLSKITNQSINEKVYKEKAWRNLLFISPSVFHRSKSLVDDPDFFFAKKGQYNPKKELIASLNSFFKSNNIVIKEKERHPRCFFAARWFWLKNRLSIDESKLPAVDCPNKKIFTQNLNYKQVSLVFSSYYVNSPASMFGHTLLRLHRETNGKKVLDHGLLDDAANYAAIVQTKNPLAYAVKGLGGGFKGSFSLMPYYKKILDYGHSERRDIWEYELNFTKKEMNFLKLLLYELGFFFIDYYYADDNCSFIILKALEAVRPSLKLSKEFPLFTVPSDTVKVLKNHNPPIVNKIEFRPSSHTKYIDRAKSLNKLELKKTKKIIKTKKIVNLETNDCGDKCRTKVIDTALDYIDYKTAIVSLKEKNSYSKLRLDLLIKRSKLKSPPEEIISKPDLATPHEGHYSGLLSLSHFKNTKDSSFKGISFLRVRPALHDFNASARGYSNLLKTNFTDFTFEYDSSSEKFDLFEFHAVEIFALRQQEPFSSPRSWHLDIGMNKDVYDIGFIDRKKRYFLEMGFGKTYGFFNERLYLYGLGQFQGGFSPHEKLRWYGGVNANIGAILPFNSYIKFTFSGRYEWLYGKDSIEFLKTSARLNFYPTYQDEIFIEAKHLWDEDFIGLGYRKYL